MRPIPGSTSRTPCTSIGATWPSGGRSASAPFWGRSRPSGSPDPPRGALGFSTSSSRGRNCRSWRARRSTRRWRSTAFPERPLSPRRQTSRPGARGDRMPGSRFVFVRRITDASIRPCRPAVGDRAGGSPGRPDPRSRRAQARSRSAHRRRRHGEDPQVHDGAGVQLAAHGLPAGLHDRAEPERGPRRRRRGAGDPAVHGGRAPLLPDAGGGEPAGAGDLDRHERGGARADRGGGQLGGEPRASEGERRAARAAGRPAAPEAGRRARREPDHRERAGLLHHGHHPLPRDRRAHRADGARLPAGGRREPVHPRHPRAT